MKILAAVVVAVMMLAVKPSQIHSTGISPDPAFLGIQLLDLFTGRMYILTGLNKTSRARTCIGLHMGPDNLCYVTRHFLFFPMSPCHFLKDLDVTFYSFYKRPRRISTTFKVAVSHFVSYPCGALCVYSATYAFWLVQYMYYTICSEIDRVDIVRELCFMSAFD